MSVRRKALPSMVSERHPRYGAGNRVSKYMSEDEFVAWAFEAENIRAEWVNGEVIVMPPDNTQHNDVCGLVYLLFRLFVARKTLGRVFIEAIQIRLPKVVSRRQPDLIFVSRQNLHKVKDTYIDGVPDLALEVVSPDSITRDYKEKFAEYELAGIPELWFIDPLGRSFSAYSLNAAGKYERIPEKRGKIESRVLPGFFLRIEWLWKSQEMDPLTLLKKMGIK